MKPVAQTVLAAAGWFLIIQLAWWVFGPITPAITIDESQSQPWETTTAPGGSVTRMLAFHANENVTLRTYRRIVELDCDRCRIYELEAAQRTYVAGQTYRQARSVYIPEHVGPGRYRMEVEARWRANPLRDGMMMIPPFTITVVAPK